MWKIWEQNIGKWLSPILIWWRMNSRECIIAYKVLSYLLFKLMKTQTKIYYSSSDQRDHCIQYCKRALLAAARLSFFQIHSFDDWSVTYTYNLKGFWKHYKSYKFKGIVAKYLVQRQHTIQPNFANFVRIRCFSIIYSMF